MRKAVPLILQRIAAARPTAFCRLVETRGSTPQKAGAVMLVYADGSQDGTLGGGCVEAEVKRRAMVVLDSAVAEVAEFQLDHDYGWDDGLICGGRMRVLILPLLGEQHRDYFETLAQHLEMGRGIVEAIVVTAAADATETPVCFLFDDAHNLLATMDTAAHGSRTVDATLRHGLQQLAGRSKPQVLNGVAYLPIEPRHRLLIVGAGHIGQAVAELACQLQFDVWVVDDRDDCVSEARFPQVSRRIVGPLAEVLPELKINDSTYCLIVTRGHNHDQEALFHLVNRSARYIGLIGSRRKIKLIFDNLLAEGVSQANLERVFAPIGINIGSQSVPEIAVSVAAELVAHRNLDGQVPGRPDSVPVSSDGESS